MQTPFDTLSEPLPRRVVAGLAKLSLVLRHEAWSQGREQRLTPTQAQVLTLLRARGPLRLSTLADELAVRAPTASQAVTALETKGLLRREPAADDRRARAIRLTDRGTAEAERLSDWPDVLQAAVDDLPEAEQAALLRLLTRTIRGLQARGAIPVQRMCASCRYFRPHAHDDPATPHHCAFVDAPFGDRHLRLDCPDHEPADGALARRNWRRFTASHPTPED
ncbi:MarR family winged helix-turn-helix transcriptional regulator [Sediminicurvatus halobius]|uniref:MarR family transcriptional regulator n=1 Tax=Sediminicurvatus halobius TaxID=2182432 RepID=A0A2U2N2U7_9GAMM|nr:MarR family winged helix-turn-helix transcriptional regulator [Spiribacter halobius]PWG63526.1 MarR family transcriptional regulator [Spiribacter halobius]UEX79600.1 MarR family winged helix-turn-helix transcriptional regulator [Spiribacter halobius]